MDASFDDTLGRFDSRELHDLLCNLSDELCRPLASMRTGFDLLLDGETSPLSVVQQGHVSTIRRLCDDMLRLTRSHLDYAEVIRAARPPKLGTFSIRALVQEVDRSFAAAARGRGQSWETEAQNGETAVVTDASRCQQIFETLVSNALKFTPPGGRIRVEGKAEGDFWSFTVADDGPGIPVDQHHRIFEPFFRLARDEHSSIEGNGLGLPIGRELAAQLGGKIHLDSDEGCGTVVRVIFPRSPIAIDPTGDPA